MQIQIRRAINTEIDAIELKKMIKTGRGKEVINPFDEIDVPLEHGGTVKVVCAYVDDKMARFVFKDCWDKDVMNDETTNETGYYCSDGRNHVLFAIYPCISEEWRSIITPRKLTETIDGEKIEYSDPLWLPSATDVYGDIYPKWWDDEVDSFQLPIFTRNRNCVKECAQNYTVEWWLRSVVTRTNHAFTHVSISGNYSYCDSSYSFGFAPGFDI